MHDKMPNDNLRQFLEKINTICPLKKKVSMAELTTFKTGGIAQWYLTPSTVEQLSIIKKEATHYDIALFILGKGANILVSDKGIKEPVIDLQAFNQIKLAKENRVEVQAGYSMDQLGDFLLSHQLSGLEFTAGLPGSVGGAIWMNARCYDHSIDEFLVHVDYLDQQGNIKRLVPSKGDFGYKKSPFQNKEWIILAATFKLQRGTTDAIKSIMEKRVENRKSKGHYNFPCAGSVFKNNRSFGMSSGKLIDSLGLRGTQKGGAQIADYHANIIINKNHATADDIMDLIILIQERVKKQFGFILDPEVIPIGDWSHYSLIKG